MNNPGGRRRAGLLIPLFRVLKQRELGHRRHRRHSCRLITEWLRRAQARASCSCCRSTRWRRASRLRTRRSARWRSIRIFISMRGVSDFEAAWRRSPRFRADEIARGWRRCAPRRRFGTGRRAEADGAAGRVRPFSRRRVVARHRARARPPRIPERTGVVDRGLRDLPRAARPPRRAAVDRMARCAPADRGASGRDRSRAARARPRRALPSVPAVACGLDMWAATRVAVHPRRRALRRSAVHGRRCDSADVWARHTSVPGPRRIGRRAARRVQRDRPGTGACRSIAGTSSRANSSDGCSSARGAAPICTTATAWIILVGFYRTYGRPADGSAPFFSRCIRRGRADRAWRARVGRRSASPAPRSSPRISAPFRISSARRWRALPCRVSRCSAGSGTGTRPASRTATPRRTRRSRWRHRAPTTPNRSSSGHEGVPQENERQMINDVPTIARVTGGRSD